MQIRGFRPYAAVLLLVVASLVTNGREARAGEYDPAGHPNCPHGENYVSSACILQPSPHWGIYAEMANVPMTMSDAKHQDNGHINHAVWTYAGEPCTYFIEAGITKGYHPRPQSDNYGWYWGYRNLDAPLGVFFFIGTPVASPDNGYRRYWLRYNGGGEYSALIDHADGAGFRHWGRVATGFGSCLSQTGLEEVKHFVGGFPEIPGPFYSSATNNILNIKYQTSAYPAGANYETFLSGNTAAPPAQWKWIDYPCQQGNFPPYCLNGLHHSNIWWAANHPTQ